MKLKDVAFMVDLINTNYRRRMKYFLINVLAIVVPFPLGIIFRYFGTDYVELNIICIGFLFSLVIGATFRAVATYVIKINGDDQLYFPWNIKKRQMTALREVIEAKAEFEELGYSVPLHEYFDR